MRDAISFENPSQSLKFSHQKRETERPIFVMEENAFNIWKQLEIILVACMYSSCFIIQSLVYNMLQIIAKNINKYIVAWLHVNRFKFQNQIRSTERPNRK